MKREFYCLDCKKAFQQHVPGSASAHCPKCGSHNDVVGATHPFVEISKRRGKHEDSNRHKGEETITV